jgi:hypothetical protein
MARFLMQMRPLAVVFSVALIAGCQKPPRPAAPAPAAETHFAVVLERSAKGWAAHCETGCSWVDVTMSCEGCDVQLDASGIARASVATAPKGFAFVLSDTRSGWMARGIQGLRWEKLSWGCDSQVCRVRLDETGVTGGA